MKKLIMAVILAALVAPAMAQENPKKKNRKQERRDRVNAMIKQEEEGVIAYKKHFAVGAKLYTDGYGIFFEKGYARSIKKVTLFQLEIAERKHEKETKTSREFISGSPYIFGKRNFFYPIRIGVQQQYLLGNKSNKNGVSITANVGGGISLGLLRQYQVEVDKAGQPTYVSYESDSALFLNDQAILRGPGLGKGWNHLKFSPGLYLKPALRFDYGRYNELLTAVEVGLLAEFYAKKVPQMVYNKERQFFFSAYVGITFGKRK